MRPVSLTSMGLALIVASLGAQAPPKTAGRDAAKWTVPRAADGHADLSGVWANNSVTPLERPKEWAGKDRLTDAELDQLKRDISQVYDEAGDAIFQNVVEIHEYACHESNYSMPGILGGARVKERTAAQKSNQKPK